MKDELAAIANRSGLDGNVYDMTRDGRNSTNYTFSEAWGGVTYAEVLTRARLYVCLAGDVWSDTNIWNAMECAAIPVVERRPSYKGCVDPTGWLRESGAPVLWVDDWSELPAVLADALADDDALEARRLALVAWWTAEKRKIGGDIVAFNERWRDAEDFPRNDCVQVALSDAQEEAYQRELEAYYAQEHWFENYVDSPWISSPLCWKRRSEYWSGLQCYSAKCAKPAVASFTCGNETLSI